LDNRCYARKPDGALINDAGTGNILDASDPVARALMLETLRHFARHGRGRFPLRSRHHSRPRPAFDPQAPIFAEIAHDPLLRGRIMIAEPWDVGPGGINWDNFRWLAGMERPLRDDVRRFWRGDPGTLGALATRMTGSSDIFSGKAEPQREFHRLSRRHDLGRYRVLCRQAQ
jgi:glycogen operon protein